MNSMQYEIPATTTAVILARKREIEDMLEMALWWALVLTLLLIGIFVVVSIRSRYRGREDHAASAHLMLAQLGDLRREGDLTDDEFRSIKSRLVETINGTVRQPSGDEELKNSDSVDEESLDS